MYRSTWRDGEHRRISCFCRSNGIARNTAIEQPSASPEAATAPAFAGDVAVVPLGAEAADRFGKLEAAPIARGTPIGALDTMIAAHRCGLTLVTHNLKHFRRLRGLEVADWL